MDLRLVLILIIYTMGFGLMFTRNFDTKDEARVRVKQKIIFEGVIPKGVSQYAEIPKDIKK